MKYQIWYAKPEAFGNMLTSANDLSATHVHLTDIEAHGLDAAWCAMQGEIWSPNGEARELIQSKGLQHTSMSVGDVIIDDVGNAHTVAGAGFKAIGGVR